MAFQALPPQRRGAAAQGCSPHYYYRIVFWFLKPRSNMPRGFNIKKVKYFAERCRGGSLCPPAAVPYSLMMLFAAKRASCLQDTYRASAAQGLPCPFSMLRSLPVGMSCWTAWKPFWFPLGRNAPTLPAWFSVGNGLDRSGWMQSLPVGMSCWTGKASPLPSSKVSVPTGRDVLLDMIGNRRFTVEHCFSPYR